MPKPDDSSLSPEDLQVVEQRARLLLDRADAWDRFPVPLQDILDAAEVKLVSHSIFDPAELLTYIQGKAGSVVKNIKSAISKVLGLYDANENLIHIDQSTLPVRQTFLTLHETGHHQMPTHKKLFGIFGDCEKTLSPEIADQFEREANNFARFALFKGDTYRDFAADCEFGIKTPMALAKKFGSSITASAREFARSNARACVVYVLEHPQFGEGAGFRSAVRRIEPSRKFVEEFGVPTAGDVTPDHFLGPIVPIGRKMTRPTTLSLTDKNGDAHECVAEAFDNTYYVLVLLYPVKELTSTTVLIGT